MADKSKSKTVKKSRRKTSELPGGNCRLLENFLRESEIKQWQFSEKTGIPASKLSRMNVGMYIPTDDDQAKMITAGMSEKSVKAFAKAIRISMARNGNSSVRKTKSVRIQKKAPAKHNGVNGSISKEGVAVLQRITDRYNGKIPTSLALVIMEEFS